MATSIFLLFIEKEYYICENNLRMKKHIFSFLAKINKAILPSYAKKQLDLSKATKLQMAIIGWRYYITTNALD